MPDTVAGLPRSVLALGSNQGDRERFLLEAMVRIRALTADEELAVSGLYESEPWGETNQPMFLNAACVGRFAMGPERLLDELLAIERQLGRPARHPKWGPRKIDLDIVWVDGLRRSGGRLEIPHPRAAERAFVLAPVREIAPHIATDLGPPHPGEEKLRLIVPRDEVKRRLEVGHTS